MNSLVTGISINRSPFSLRQCDGGRYDGHCCILSMPLETGVTMCSDDKMVEMGCWGMYVAFDGLLPRTLCRR